MSTQDPEPETDNVLPWPKLDPEGVRRAVRTVSRGIEASRIATPKALGDFRGLEDLSDDEISFLLYAESACVENYGMLKREKLNRADHHALVRFTLLGLMRVEDVDPVEFPSKSRIWSHRVQLKEAGWLFAHAARLERANRERSPASDEAALSLAMDRRRERIAKNSGISMETTK